MNQLVGSGRRPCRQRSWWLRFRHIDIRCTDGESERTEREVKNVWNAQKNRLADGERRTEVGVLGRVRTRGRSMDYQLRRHTPNCNWHLPRSHVDTYKPFALQTCSTSRSWLVVCGILAWCGWYGCVCSGYGAVWAGEFNIISARCVSSLNCHSGGERKRLHMRTYSKTLQLQRSSYAR